MMKKIGLAVLLGIMSASAVSATKVEQVLDGYINAWNAHDIAKIDSYYGKDVIWYDLASDATVKGKSNVSKAITDYFMGYVPDMYWVKNGDLHVSGNTVVYEWLYGGTFNGSWGELKIENKNFALKGISSTTIDDNGKIISHKDYYDLDSFKRALGVTQ